MSTFASEFLVKLLDPHTACTYEYGNKTLLLKSGETYVVDHETNEVYQFETVESYNPEDQPQGLGFPK